jgi:hypothetical protein
MVVVFLVVGQILGLDAREQLRNVLLQVLVRKYMGIVGHSNVTVLVLLLD